ncbi:MAG: hypothetical protein RSC76_05845 [Oscillospiraceae bacterium]
MKYIGIPSCPYCKKRVNIIRIWSMKKHGEYQCPRCKGISNIFLSPLIYVFAVIAIAAAFLLYFFQKFIFDSITIFSGVQVLIPFLIFFLLSLFMVYLEKPVIKRIRKTADGKYFDQNGNELKMKMGKLVAKNAEKTTVANEDFSSVKNTRNTTDESGEKYQRPASVSPPRGKRQNVPLYTENENFGDNEDLYAAAANHLGREFTTQVDTKEVKAAIQAEPPKKYATEKREHPIERNEIPPVPVGKIAAERNQKRVTKSGFEDIIAEYEKSVNQPDERPPLPKEWSLEGESKKSKFREL